MLTGIKLNRLNNSIKQILKTFGAIVFYYCGLFYLVRFINNLFGRRLTILTYHRVTDREIEDINSSLPFLYVTVDSFEQQLKSIKKHYTILTFHELSAHFYNSALPRNSLIITFDDGYEDNFSMAYPVLQKHNVIATFFITVDKIGKNDRQFWWDRAYCYFKKLEDIERNGAVPRVADNILSLYIKFKKNTSKFFNELNKWETEKIEGMLSILEEKHGMRGENILSENKILTWEQINEMEDNIEIGSHTCAHKNLVKLNEFQKIYEVEESKKIIEKNTNKRVIAFSYPAGNKDRYIEKLVQKSGYEFGVTTVSGVNGSKERFSLKRINVWEGTSRSLNGKFSEGTFLFNLLGIR